MSDYITNFLVTLVVVLALLISAIGLSSVYSTNAKADNVKIEKQMEELETLFNELYGFHKSPNFHENGFSSLGRGKWSDRVKKLSGDEKLNTYVGTLIPDALGEPHPLWPLKVNDMGSLGQVYYRNTGEDNVESLRIKTNFINLFKLHKSRTK